MRKLIIVGAAALLVLLMAAVALALVDFDSPALGRAALDQAEAATGAELSAEAFRLNLLDGLVAEGVTAEGALSGGSYRLELERLVFEHRLLPLLSGTVAVERIRVERPHLALVTLSGGRAPAAGTEEAGPDEESGVAGPSIAVAEIEIVQGQVSMRDERGGVAPITIDGIDLTLSGLGLDPGAATPLAGVKGSGRLSMERVRLEATEVSEAAGEFTLEGGRLQTGGVAFRTPEGRFSADLAVDLAGVPIRYEMALQGDPLDLNRASGSPGGLGPATFSLDATGRGTEAAGVEGRGRVSLAAGTLPRHPVLLGLEQATGLSGVAGAGYEASETTFRVEDERVVLEPLVLRSGDVSLDLSGRIGLDPDQTLDLALVVVAPRQGVRIEGVGDAALDALTDPEGRVRIPVRVAGPSQSPRVRPDAGAMMASARSAGARSLGQKAAKKLGRIFGND